MINRAMMSIMEERSAPAASSNIRTQRLSSDTFANHLATEATKSGVATAAAADSQTNAAGQVSVAPAAQTSTLSPLQELIQMCQASSPASTTSASSSSKPAAAPASSGDTADDDYWASQPAAVQQLRNIQNPNQRAELANQLAGEGYKIDLPIMVWGWDPVTTMQMRESYGYTWVPSLGQQPIAVAPGLSCPGATSYNPADPPAGSISVCVPS